MRERRNLALIHRLAGVERARRGAAEAALHEAAASAAKARTAEDEAFARSAAAQHEWSAHLASAGFSPEYAGALSARAIQRQSEAARASHKAVQQEQARTEKQRQWQLLDARVRQTERSERRLSRKISRDGEEKRVADLADRITTLWSRS